MKKIFYGILIFIIILVFAYLIYFRLNNKIVDKSFVSQIIIPVAKTEQQDNKDATVTSYTPETQISTVVNLDLGDVFISEIDTDLDIDGFEDKVVVFRRNSDNGIYLIPAFHNPILKEYVLGEPTKLEITQVNTISLYALELGLDTKPAIVCSGTTVDNIQVLSIFLVEPSSTSKQSLVQIAVFHADVQIRINKNDRAQTIGLGLYTISCFETDIGQPNSLSQIEKTYTWSETERLFKKDSERIIPGERVENQMLQRIGSGDIALFREFLQGLWDHAANMSTSEEKLMYFDNTENEIIFTDGELQEVYVISNVSQRRYGLYFTTYNKSLTNIILRVDIEIKSLNEVSIHVVESVTRLKIGAESLWDGVYRKKDDSITRETKLQNTNETEKAIKQPHIIWKNETYELTLLDDTFRFFTPFGLKTGIYTLVTIQNKTILQLKDNTGKTFYEISLKNGTIVLSEVKIKINTVQNTGAQEIVLKPTPIENN
ncbi:MAG: pallilysin-related adhesin [Spirochaetaceae bacterium]|nr:pallilysin-related adhesin [Spirochaetaceae bacterium]